MTRPFAIAVASSLAAFANAAASAQSIREPLVIKWGASTDKMLERLRGKCDKVTVRAIKAPFLTGVRHQQQIDCEGFSYFGGKRHVEFVIGDNSLEMVGIMIDPSEHSSAFRAMLRTYGPARHRREDMFGWPGRRTGLKSKPAEFLFYSPRQAAEWREWFGEPLKPVCCAKPRSKP